MGKQVLFGQLGFCLFVCFGGSGVWTQGFALAKQASITWATPPVHIALVILEMGGVGSLELFAPAGLKPQPPDLSLPSS
jgi:hypothetical protein